MTKYEYLINKRDNCIRMASTTEDAYLRTFYANAAQGYEQKAKRLLLGEANGN